jgi:acyl-coenzyme A synthetase/AMP-(fatty) acid ligase
VEDGIFFEPTSAEGEIVRLEAAVVAPNVQPKEILQALRQRVDSAFLPRRIHMLDSLPRNSTGKIPKEEILKLVSQPR